MPKVTQIGVDEVSAGSPLPDYNQCMEPLCCKQERTSSVQGMERGLVTGISMNRVGRVERDEGHKTSRGLTTDSLAASLRSLAGF